MLSLLKNIIPVDSEYFSKLRLHTILEFYDFPYLTLDEIYPSEKFLNWYLLGKSDKIDRILLPINNQNLEDFLARKKTLYELYNSAPILYYIQVNNSNEVTASYAVTGREVSEHNLIQKNYILPIDWSRAP